MIYRLKLSFLSRTLWYINRRKQKTWYHFPFRQGCGSFLSRQFYKFHEKVFPRYPGSSGSNVKSSGGGTWSISTSMETVEMVISGLRSFFLFPELFFWKMGLLKIFLDIISFHYHFQTYLRAVNFGMYIFLFRGCVFWGAWGVWIPVPPRRLSSSIGGHKSSV